MIEWAVALPSLTMKMNLALGKSSTTYVPILMVRGSLLQSLGAGSPCLAMISNVNAAMAESRTDLVIPACSSRRNSFGDLSQWKRSCKRRGITRVSWPHLEENWGFRGLRDCHAIWWLIVGWTRNMKGSLWNTKLSSGWNGVVRGELKSSFVCEHGY